jgi:hypothetical protein
MNCREKRELTEQCITACNELEAATQQLKASTGFLIDFRTQGITWAPPQTLKNWPAEFSHFADARTKHRNASLLLSRHLSQHRC